MYKLETGIHSERGGSRGPSGEAPEWDVRAKSESPEYHVIPEPMEVLASLGEFGYFEVLGDVLRVM